MFSPADAIRVLMHRDLTDRGMPSTRGDEFLTQCVEWADALMRDPKDGATRFVAMYPHKNHSFRTFALTDKMDEIVQDTCIIVPVGNILKATLERVRIVLENPEVNWDHHHISDENDIVLVGLSSEEMRMFKAIRAARLSTGNAHSSSTDAEIYASLVQKYAAAMKEKRKMAPNRSFTL
jgi:hypothetical protein